MRVVTIIDALWVEISDGDVPVPWAGLGSTGGLSSGPLASSLAVRSVRHPLGEVAQTTEILPSITLATHTASYTHWPRLGPHQRCRGIAPLHRSQEPRRYRPCWHCAVEGIRCDCEGIPALGLLAQPGVLASLSQLREVGDLVCSRWGTDAHDQIVQMVEPPDPVEIGVRGRRIALEPEAPGQVAWVRHDRRAQRRGPAGNAGSLH